MRFRPAGRSVRCHQWAFVVLVVATLVATGLGVLSTAPQSPRPLLPPANLSAASRAAAVASIHTGPAPTNAAAAAAVPSSSVSSAGVVTRTIFPGFNTSLPGSFTSSVATWVMGTPTYVPSTNTLWFPQRSVAVPGDPWPTVAPAAVFNLTTGGFDRLVTNLSNVSALAYNPANGEVYGTLPQLNAVVGVDSRTGSQVTPLIPVGNDPSALAFDANTDSLFVANYGSSNVTVINTLQNTVSDSGIAVGSKPTSLAFDPHDSLVFVANSGNKVVSVVNASDLAAPVDSITIFYGPAIGIAFSAKSGNLVATNPLSAYATLINASTEAVVTSVAVGTGMVPAAPADNGAAFIVGNASGSNLIVLDSTDGSIVGSGITTASNVTELVVDSRTGADYSWSSLPRELSQLNVSTDSSTLVSPTALPTVDSLSFSTALSRVFASSTSTSLLYTIDQDSLGLSSPSIPTVSTLLSVAANATGPDIFVGTSTGLYLYNSTSSQIQGPLAGLTGSCTQLVLDPAHDLLWLSNGPTGVVAVDTSSLSVAIPTGISLPGGAVQGIAIDVPDAETFVLTSSTSLAVLNAISGGEIESGLQVGLNVTTLVFDPADDQVYSIGDSITLVDGASHAIDGGPVSLGGPHEVLGAAYDPSREELYVSTSGFEPGIQGSVAIVDGSSIAGLADSEVRVPVGENPSAIVIVAASRQTSSGLGMVWVANEQSGTISVISTPPQVTYFEAVPATIDLGEATSIDVALEGGAGPTNQVFAPLPPGCQTEDVFELNCTPTEPGNYTVNVTVTDSLGVTTEASASLSVLQALSIKTSFSPASFPEVDTALPIQGTAQAENGMPPYSIQWNFGDGSAASGTDVSHAYLSPGTYIINTEVRDTSGASVNSSSLVTVVPRPTASIAASPGLSTDVDFPISFFGNVSGGVGGSGGNWSFGDGTNAFGNVVTHAWTSVGSYNVTFRFVDALGVAANFSVEVLVNPPLTATFTSGMLSATTSGYTGTLIPFTALVSGGTWPYTVLWSFGDGSNASGQGVSHPFAAAGTYRVSVVLSDSAGASLRSNLTVAVSTPSSVAGGITSLGGGFGTGLFLGLIVGGVLAAVVLFAAGPRRRSSPPAPPPTPYVPP